MSSDHYKDKYTDPELRRQIKEELLQADKGGKPGQWSARKSQMLVHEYEKRGGGYVTPEKDDAARSLEEWSEQDWQTEAGDDRARDGKVTKRYLPKAVWERLTDPDKEEADRSKEEASQKGLQHVEWTPAVKRVMDDYEAEFDRPHHHDDQQESQSKPQHFQKHPASDHDSEMTKAELYDRAKELHISGRSNMSREELLEAVEEAQKQS